MLTFKGHVLASLSCRESRSANRSTFYARFFFFLSKRFCISTWFDFEVFSSRINKFACLPRNYLLVGWGDQDEAYRDSYYEEVINIADF